MLKRLNFNISNLETIAIAAVFILISFGFSNLNSGKPIWSEKTGVGNTVAACASSSPSSPTCVNGQPSVTISWSETDNHACTAADLYIAANPGTITKTWDNPNTNAGWAGKGSDGAILARRFRSDPNMTIGQVSFHLAQMSGNVLGKLWITIETDSGNLPSGTVTGTSAQFTSSAVCVWGACGTWITFQMPTNGIALQNNKNYWIVLRGSASGQFNFLPWARVEDTSTGSKSLIRVYTNPETWSDAGAYSIVYRLHSLPSGTVASENVLGRACNDSYTWSGTDNTGYSYRLDFLTSGSYIESSTGSFTNPNCTLSGTQCDDGTDNERDGLTDLADPGCSSPTDNNEGSPGNPAGYSCTSSNQCDANLTCNSGVCGAPSCTVTFSPPTVSSTGTTTLAAPDCGGSATYSCTGSIGSGTLAPGNTLSANPVQTQTCTVTGGSGQGQNVITVTPGPVQNFREVPPN